MASHVSRIVSLKPITSHPPGDTPSEFAIMLKHDVMRSCKSYPKFRGP